MHTPITAKASPTRALHRPKTLRDLGSLFEVYAKDKSLSNASTHTAKPSNSTSSPKIQLPALAISPSLSPPKIKLPALATSPSLPPPRKPVTPAKKPEKAECGAKTAPSLDKGKIRGITKSKASSKAKPKQPRKSTTHKGKPKTRFGLTSKQAETYDAKMDKEFQEAERRAQMVERAGQFGDGDSSLDFNRLNNTRAGDGLRRS